MVTTFVPVGDYPFFIQACLKNLFSTAGDNLDLRFLVTSDFSSLLKSTFELLKMRFKFKVMVAPFAYSKRGVHLDLLDWGMRQSDTPSWVYVQHLDMFWKQAGWLDGFERSCKNNPEALAFVLPYNKHQGEFKHIKCKYVLDGYQLLRTHDFAGFYNRDELLKMNLFFRWGIAQDIGSKTLLDVIENRRVISSKGVVQMNDFLDGSDAIGLELAVRNKNLVKELSADSEYVHAWDLFGMGYDMTRNGNVLNVNRTLQKSLRGLPSYSWISSFLFDKHTMRDKLFPWKLLCSFVSNAQKSKVCEFVEQYRDTNNVLGNETDGINQVRFLDCKWDYLTI